MICSHVDEVEKMAFVKQAAVSHHCPCGQVHRRQNAQTQRNPKCEVVPAQPEVRGKEKQRYNQPTLNYVKGLFQNMCARGDRVLRIVDRGVSSCQHRQEYKSGSNAAYYPVTELGQDRPRAQKVTEQFANQNQFNEFFKNQTGRISLPE